jgi:hypothetical protein
MKEKRLVSGGRMWHGDEFVEIQMENLDVIQGMFGTIGACVVSGCGLSYNNISGYWTVAAGIVAINHADGFKCVRLNSFSFLNSAPQIYLSVLKTTNTKAYNNGSTAIKEYDYSATSGTSVPSGTENIDYLVVYRPAGIRNMRQALSGNTAWTNVAVSGLGGTLAASATLKYRKNVLNNTIELIGNATITNTALASLGGELVLANFTISPATQDVYFSINSLTTGINLAGTDYVGPMTGRLATNGNFSIFFKKLTNSVSTYTITYSVIIPLD